jgi:hypothetical protein
MTDEITAHPFATEAANPDTSAERLAELSHDQALKSLIAANPATPATILEALSVEKNDAIRKNLARNPNAPVSLLLNLINEYPEELLANPIILLLTLAQPDFLKKIPGPAWLKLLNYTQLPSGWLQWLLQDAQEQYARVRQKAFLRDSRAFLPLLLIDPHIVLKNISLLTTRQKKYVIKHCKLVNATTLSQLAQTQEIELQHAVALHLRTPGEILEHLATGDPTVRRAVASNSHLPSHLLHQLAEDSEATVRSRIAHHHQTEQADLRRLANDENAEVRAAVALHRRLDDDLYWQLANDSETLVRAALARNVCTPQDVLALLAHDTETAVRANAAHNPRLPAECFFALSEDPAEDVLKSLAGNAQLPQGLFWQLTYHSLPAVREQVARNPRAPLQVLEKLLEGKESLVLEGIARNPQATPGILERLAGEDNKVIQRAVLAHKHTPEKTLIRLATRLLQEISEARKRSYNYIDELITLQRTSVNPHMPLEILTELLNISSGEPFVVAIANHPAVLHNRRQIIKDYLLVKLKQELNYGGIWSLSLPLLEEGVHQIAILEIFAGSRQWVQRYMVTQHPRAPREIIETLAQDLEPHVRAAARAALAKRFF